MSEVKVNKISPRSGTTVTLGDSGDTFTVPSGATFDASNATTTLPSTVVTTTGTQTLTNKTIDASQLSGTITPSDNTVTSAKLASGDLSISNGNLLFDTANKGIYLGVTTATASNLLDDYEEGLHTVTATDSGGGATITMNTSFDQLAYTKIGRVVHIQGTLLFASITGAWSGAFQMSLPFAAASLTDQAGRGILGVGTYNVDFTTGTAPYFNISEGSSLANMFVSGDNISGGEGRPQSSAQLYVGGSYITDA